MCRVFRKTKNFKTKSQEDTSCSFDADPDNPSNNNQHHHQQLLSEPAQFVSKQGGTGNAGGHPAEPGDYHSTAPHHHFNFTCKQELTVDDYPCSFTVLDPRAHRASYEFQHHQHHYQSSPQEFSTVEDARSSCSFMPHHSYGGGHVEDWMEQSRLRRDQTLADVTCHLSHVNKRPNFVSHENLVHLWN